MGLPSTFSDGGSGWIAAAAGGFVPDVFSKKLQAKFYKASVLPAITNNDYTGDISGPGSKVYIRTVPNITVANYTGTISAYNDPTTSSIELDIDKAKFWAFKKDDVLASLADIQFWSEASKDASEQMRIAVETDVLAGVVASATTVVDSDAAEFMNGNVVLTAAKVLDVILRAGRKLDELNIPEDRFLVIPPWMAELLKSSDLRQAYLTGDKTSPLRNGMIGQIDRFTVYVSNMLANPGVGVTDEGKTYCLAGHKKAICFASKFVKTETIKLESTFGDGVRGLQVYGYKVVVPDALAVIEARHTIDPTP